MDLEQGCKGCIEVAFAACMDDMQPKRPGGHIGAFSGAAMLVHDVWSIGHQPTRFDILPNAVQRVGSDIKCIRTALERLEGRCDVLGAPSPQFV